ncbi:hypothetical protein GCM10025864_45040 [Luteimicrobium album]|uniref:Uncharacterized protein n=1 Tax=Luteimicrobium album TaxID=1054550 RepID=A0ABQ6I7C9_9MICO|nr:hypothetical protein [Luteimicrobium album]GMA22278.1 hypothetical protein GCM10025864_00370 [Luteimicrobium album]GMA26683.1 hypothetical protein GCM10025864_44420 [Luteimicrobium album]GMA26745.1 hypothetical protein GCM10025864_45040 [Luteimicrobium album]
MAEKASADALEAAIVKLAAKAQEAPGAHALEYSTAAKDLAEARAWLLNPAQPH